MRPDWNIAAKRALVLLDRTTTDHSLYGTVISLISPPHHIDTTVPLTQDTIDAIRWISAVTKFTRFLLFYRYVSGGEPLYPYPNEHPLSAPYVLEQVRNWIAGDYKGEFKKVEVSLEKVKEALRAWEVREVPGQTNEHFKNVMSGFDRRIMDIQGDYANRVWLTDVVYQVFVDGVSLEAGTHIHEALTKQVMTWHNAIRTDLLTLGYVRSETCGSDKPDGEGKDWKRDGGWRLNGLLPSNIFFPLSLDWKKVKPKAVFDMVGITRIGFTESKGSTQMQVDYEAVMEQKCTVITENKCPICTCEWEPTNVISKLKCSHFFHQECITDWVRLGEHEKVNPTCPMCRAKQEVMKVFYPDSIPFRDEGKRGTGWCWDGDNLLRHSPEHYFLHLQPCAGAHKITHTTLQMWLYVREMYNHGRRHCWAIRELKWMPKGYVIRPYGGAALYADVTGYDEVTDQMDTRSLPDIDEHDSDDGWGDDGEQRFRWGDYGWGGITREYLRQLGAGKAEVERIVEIHPGLGERYTELDDDDGAPFGLPLSMMDFNDSEGEEKDEEEVDEDEEEEVYENGFWDDAIETQDDEGENMGDNSDLEPGYEADTEDFNMTILYVLSLRGVYDFT